MTQVSFHIFKIDEKREMDAILGRLPYGDEAFPFFGTLKWGEVGGHKYKLKVMLIFIHKARIEQKKL